MNYVDYLKLKKPVYITIKPKHNKKHDAYYIPNYSDKGKLESHRIVLYLKDNTRDFHTLLAHELIHAKQEEKKKKDIHGKSFIKYANRLSQVFGLENIYLKDVDYD